MQAPLLVWIDDLALVDLADAQGHGTEGASFGYSGIPVRGASATTLTASDGAPVIVATRLRKGSENSAKGSARIVAGALRTVRPVRSTSATGILLLPTDSASYGRPTVITVVAFNARPGRGHHRLRQPRQGHHRHDLQAHLMHPRAHRDPRTAHHPPPATYIAARGTPAGHLLRHKHRLLSRSASALPEHLSPERSTPTIIWTGGSSMVLCGHCKQRHTTVDDVRACSARGAVHVAQERSKAPEQVATRAESRNVAGLAISQDILGKDHEDEERIRLRRQHAEQARQTLQEVWKREQLLREQAEQARQIQQERRKQEGLERQRKRKADLAHQPVAPCETESQRTARLQLAKEQRQREAERLKLEQLRADKQRAEVKVREELETKKRQEQRSLEKERFEKLTPEQQQSVKEVKEASSRLPSTDEWRDH
jgi:hypothetical protein